MSRRPSRTGGASPLLAFSQTAVPARPARPAPEVEVLVDGPPPVEAPRGSIALVKAVVEPGGVDEHEGARLMNGALVAAMVRAGFAGQRVRLTITAEVVG